MRLAADLLAERTRRHGAEPLATYYDLGSGERTELSAISLRNWVDKTANLLDEAFVIADGDYVGLPLALAAPGHWLTFVWQLACWQVGLGVDLTGRDGSVAVVTGPDWQPYRGHGEVYACALRPLGMGFAAELPAPVIDFAAEVRGQPDTYAGRQPAADQVAWVDTERTLTQRDLVSFAADPAPARRLVRPRDPWATCRDGLLAPLLSGGSSVVVVGGDTDELGRIRAAERVDG